MRTIARDMNRDMTNMLRATTKMACEGVGQKCLDPQIAMCQWSSRLNLKLKKKILHRVQVVHGMEARCCRCSSPIATLLPYRHQIKIITYRCCLWPTSHCFLIEVSHPCVTPFMCTKSNYEL